MIIRRHATPEGIVYRVARASDHFPQHMVALVREARAQALPLAIAERGALDDCVLVVGPLGAEEEARFRARWSDFLADRAR
jgi:hypothetical protein